jgi:hypothetical protein
MSVVSVLWWGLGKSAPLARCAVRPWGTLANLFVKHIVRFFSLLIGIVSNRGSLFTF